MIDFVGAGCGAADLITVRGAELLKTADVLIYAGSLINPDLLAYAPPHCQLLNSAEMTLEQVIAAMRQAEEAGLHTVRLHSGDPCLYGTIREQFDQLEQLQLEYAVCPGVSSFSGAAAALRREYTLPGVSQSVIITRLAGRTPVPERESIRNLAACGATMVIFLSAGLTAEVERELLAGGYAAETPAAIVYKASWPDQLVLPCTVGSLHAIAVEHSINNLALITVGNFLGSDYQLSKLYDAAFTTAFRAAEEAR
jgi:precorrin-4/cobalt-precorrin-4 C11-methyltransferase